MSLIHVTKDGKCAFCNAGVKKCAEITCQNFFHPDSILHRFCLPKCKAKNYRRNRSKRITDRLLALTTSELIIPV
jgi:hypothetical protein